MKLIVPVILIVLGMIGLVTMGIVQGGVPELQVADVLDKPAQAREVKVHGYIGRIDSETRPLRFAVQDKLDPTRMIDVVCDTTRPDTFQIQYDVAVQGRWNAEKSLFEADQVFTKCPSKYDAEDKVQPGVEYTPGEDAAPQEGATNPTAPPAAVAGRND